MENSFRKLIVWQKAMDLVAETYDIIKLLPKEEKYALSDQMRRSVISIPSNIAEGQARNSVKEFIQFLSIAKGSNAELQTQCLLCVRLQYVTDETVSKALCLSDEVGKILNTLILKLTTKNLQLRRRYEE